RLAVIWALLLTARRATSSLVRPLPRIMASSLAWSSCVTLPTGASGPTAPGAAGGGASVGFAGAWAKVWLAPTRIASTLRATRAFRVMDSVLLQRLLVRTGAGLRSAGTPRGA